MATNLGTIWAELGLRLDKFETGMRNAETMIAGAEKRFESFEKIGERMSGVGQSLTMGVTLPIVGIATAAAKMSMDFNTAMADVATLIPGNIERVEELKTTVQDMAIETGKATTDLSRGLYQVISAFGDTSDTAKILEINARAAAAGLATTEEAIALTSAVTKGYGDTSAEAVTKVADLALLTVRLGQTTFPELAGSLGRVTPLAAELGVETEELFAAMATLTGVTGGAAEVSTQLRAVFQGIMQPSGEMAVALSKVALELEKQGKLTAGPMVDGWRAAREAVDHAVADLQVLQAQLAVTDTTTREGKQSARELTAAIRDQEKHVGTLSESVEGYAAALGPTIVETAGLETTLKLLTDTAGGNTDQLGNLFGSVEGLTAVLALSGGQAETFSQRLQDMGAYAGATDIAFAEQIEGINKAGFAWRQMRAQLEVAAQEIGDKLAPALTTLLGSIKGLVAWVTNLSDRTQHIILVLGGIVAAVGPLLLVLGTLFSSISKISAGLAAMKIALATTKGFLFGTGAVAGGAAAKVGILSGALTFLNAKLLPLKAAFLAVTAKVWVVIAVVAALAAGVYFLITRWDEVRTFLLQTWDTIKAKAIEVWDGLVQYFTVTVPAELEKFVTWFSELPGRIAEFLITLATETIPYWIGFALGTMVRLVFEGIEEAVKFFREMPGRVLEFLVTLGTNIATEFGKARNTIRTVVNEAIEIAVTFFRNLPGRVWTELLRLPVRIREILGSLNSAARDIAQGAVDGFMGIVTGLPNLLWGVISGLAGTVANAARGLATAAMNAASSLWEGFKSGLGISSPSYLEEAMMDIMEQSHKMLGALQTDFQALSGLQVRPKLDMMMPQATRAIATPAVAAAGAVVYHGPLFTVQNMTVRSDADIENISRQLHRQIQIGTRARGI